MTVTATLSHPPYLGGALTTDVPALFHAALAGRPLLVEDGGDEALFPEGSWRHETVPLQRQQFDTGSRPGEATINPEGAWRRTIDSWHKGAGQDHYDRVDANPFRFRESKGIDPWDDWQITLLKDVLQGGSTSETNVKVLVVNTRLYFIDGDTISYVTALLPTPTGGTITITGSPGDFKDLASDGHNVYVTDGANVWQFAWDASATGAAWSTLDADVIEFVNGRLMAAQDDDLFYFAADGTLGAAVTIGATLPTQWTWVGFAEGPQAIYAAGSAGDRGLVFQIPIKSDGSGLDAATVAAQLPDGQIVTAIFSYIGFVFIGTNTGVRFAEPGDTGLTLGGKLLTNTTVRCFEGQDRFVWFGWEDFDSTSTGLGRLDMREFSSVEKLEPAYASDLMATAQGDVTSCATFDGLRVFTVAGVGAFVEHPTDYVAEGYVTSGDMNFGLVEPKLALKVWAQADAVGSHQVELRTEDGDFASLGVHTDDTPFLAGQDRGRWFELRLTLFRSDDDESAPSIGALMLEVQPSVPGSVLLYAPFILHSKVELARGQKRTVDVEFELANIAALNQTRQVVTYQEGKGRHQVTVEDHEFRLWRIDPATGNREGTVMVKMKEV